MTEIRDGEWVLVEHDPELGRSIWHLHQDGFDHFRIDYPVEQILEQNKEDFNNAPQNWAGDYHKIASMPLNVLYGSGLDEAIIQRDKKFVSRFLNDSDNKAWRTRGGKI